MKATSFRVLFLPLLMANALDYELYASEVAEFVNCNSAGKAITVVPSNYSEDFHRASMIFEKLALLTPLNKVRLLPNADKIVNGVVVKEDFVLVVSSRPSETIFAQIFDRLHPLKIQTSAVLVLSEMSDGIWQNVKESGEQLFESSFFYLAHPTATGALSWHQVITLKGQSQVVINQLTFQNANDRVLVIVEDYDLQGLNITSYSLPWAPYLKLDDCNEHGMECNSYGSHHDFTVMISSQLNFTLTSFKDPDGDWGVLSKNGIFNLTHGEWGGVMGKVLLGDYPLALSEWRYVYERDDLMDFAITGGNRFLLALTPQPLEVDTGLFIRPFTPDSWQAIFLMFALLITTLALPYFSLSYFEATSGYMIAYTTAWYFFVLLNAFYGGALTMFFTSKVSIPFESVRDVMRAYPAWKLIVMDGNQVNYQFQVEADDPDYVALWDRMENSPEETLFSNIEEGLKMVSEDRNVMHVFEGMLRGYFRENPFHQQKLEIFGRGKPLLQALLFTKNSPLKPIFHFGLSRLRERGTLQRVFDFWEGREVQSNTEADKIVLSPGQVVLVYMIIGLAVVLSLTMLAGEKIWIRLKGLSVVNRVMVASADLVKLRNKTNKNNKVHLAAERMAAVSETGSASRELMILSNRRKRNETKWAVNYNPF